VESFELISRHPRRQRLRHRLVAVLVPVTVAGEAETRPVGIGEKIVRKTHRRQTMEESYREIHRVFEEWCSELSRKHNRYRNKAYENTAVQLGVAKSTVERAVHFVEAGKVERVS
jgi:hypothetical protein